MRIFTAFLLLLSLLGLAASGIALAQAQAISWHAGACYLMLVIWNLKSLVEDLHDLVGRSLERRRDAQLTWAIRFALRSAAPAPHEVKVKPPELVRLEEARERVIEVAHDYVRAPMWDGDLSAGLYQQLEVAVQELEGAEEAAKGNNG